MWKVHKGQRPNLIEGLPRPIEQLMVTCWDPKPDNRPSMDEVHERMKILCQLFPEPEPLSFYDEYSDDVVDEMGSNTGDFDSVYWPTDATERPQIRINAMSELSNYQTEDRYGSRTPTGSQFLMPATPTVDARWASGDSSGNPKIVSSFQNSNHPPTVRGFEGTSSFSQPLSLEIDPNAWELNGQNLQHFICEWTFLFLFFFFV